MSVIATRIYDDKIVISADSQLTQGWTAFKEDKSAKIFESNLGMIVGGAGDAVTLQLMKIFSKQRVPKEPTMDDVTDYYHEFVEWLDDNSNDVEDSNSWHLLYKGKAFLVEKYYVQEITTYSAIGSGMEYALAAMHLGHSPYEAVKVACDLNIYCAEPVNTYTMKR